MRDLAGGSPDHEARVRVFWHAGRERPQTQTVAPSRVPDACVKHWAPFPTTQHTH